MTIACPYCMTALPAPGIVSTTEFGKLIMLCTCGEMYGIDVQVTGRRLTDEEQWDIRTDPGWPSLEERQKEIRELYKAGTH